jgi:hypothetical protein
MTASARQSTTRERLFLFRFFVLVGVVLFALAAFAAGGDALASIPSWSWGFGAGGAWMIAWAVP